MLVEQAAEAARPRGRSSKPSAASGAITAPPPMRANTASPTSPQRKDPMKSSKPETGLPSKKRGRPKKDEKSPSPVPSVASSVVRQSLRTQAHPQAEVAKQKAAAAPSVLPAKKKRGRPPKHEEGVKKPAVLDSKRKPPKDGRAPNGQKLEAVRPVPKV